MSGYPLRPIIYVLVVGGIIILALIFFGILSEDDETNANGSALDFAQIEQTSEPVASRVVATGFLPVKQTNVVTGHAHPSDNVLVLTPARPDERMITDFPS